MSVDEDGRVARLYLALGRLHRAIRRSSAGMPAGQVSALATLAAHGPMRAGDLAVREMVSAPTLSRTLTALADAGLLARRADPDDRRCALLSVTEAGQVVLARVRTERTTLLADRLARLAPDDQARVLACLEAIEALADDAGQRPLAGAASILSG